MEKFGIKETKEILIFGFDLKDFLAALRTGGKFNLKAGLKVPGLIRSGFKGFGGIEKVRDELMDRSEEEKQELYDLARKRYSNANQAIEELVEDTIAEVLDMVELGFRWHEATAKKAA